MVYREAMLCICPWIEYQDIAISYKALKNLQFLEAEDNTVNLQQTEVRNSSKHEEGRGEEEEER